MVRFSHSGYDSFSMQFFRKNRNECNEAYDESMTLLRAGKAVVERRRAMQSK